MRREQIERTIREITVMVRKDEFGELEVEQLLKSMLKEIAEEIVGARRVRA